MAQECNSNHQESRPVGNLGLADTFSNQNAHVRTSRLVADRVQTAPNSLPHPAGDGV
jgi:hypothetical protein